MNDHGRDRLRGLDELLAPRSIAVIGAADAGPTRELITNLGALGFDGPILPVNPRRATVAGLACAPTVAECSSAPDLAVIAVATEHVLPAVRECAEAGVRSLLIYTAGLAENGESGAALQREISAVAGEADMRLLGPNCLGYVNVRERVAAAAFPAASLPPDLVAGPVGLVSQSGGLMISCLELGTRLGLRFGLLLSTGNEADVTGLDGLQHLVHDDETRAIGFVLEAMSDGRRFVDIAIQALEVDKPIAVLRLGRSARGRAAALTHTASVIGPPAEFRAVCAEFGVSICRTPAELVDRLTLFGKRRSRSAGRLAVVTMSGGTRVLLSDVAEDNDLELATLAPATEATLRAALPSFATIDNPLDLTPAGVRERETVRTCVQALADDPTVGTVVLALHLKNGGGSAVQQGLIEEFCAVGESTDRQFAVVSSIPEGLSGHWRQRAAEGSVPFLNDLAALAAVRDLRSFDERRPGRTRPVPAPIVALPSTESGVGALSEAASYAVLERAGVPVAPWRLCQDEAQARAVAAELGFPVAVKVCSPDVLHKKDVGGVLAGIVDVDALRAAYESVLRSTRTARPDARIEGVLIQRMADDGVEVLVGTSMTQFGPSVTVGLGGAWTEIFADVASRLCPVDVTTAGDMIDELRAVALLDGSRGGEAKDVTALARIISLVSAAALAWNVSAIEINPVIVSVGGAHAVDAVILGQPPHHPNDQER